MAQNGLIHRLREIQKAHRWKDKEIAKRLGISRSYWVHLRHGKRNPGVKFVRGALSAFPELEDETLAYLAGEE